MDEGGEWPPRSLSPIVPLDLLDILPNGIIIIRDTTEILYMNRACEKVIGCARHELIGQRLHSDLWSSYDVLGEQIPFGFFVDLVLRTGEPRRGVVWQTVFPDGRRVWIEGTIAPITPEPGVRAALFALTDITAQVMAQRQTFLQFQQLQAMVEHAPVGACVLDEQGRHEVANAAYCAVYGYHPEEVINQPFTLMVPPERHDIMRTRHHAIMQQQGRSAGDFEAIRKGGRRILVRTSTTVFAGGDGQLHRTVFVEDLTERLREEERLLAQASSDGLTGLANRVLLERRLTTALIEAAGRGRHVAVLFLDFDGFKEVNDTYGHAAGDAALVAIAQRLRGQGRMSDLVARWGGDEFVIALTGLEREEDALALAYKVQAAFAEPLPLRWDKVTLGVSIGVAVSPTDGETPALLINRADAAMYAAKRAGKGQIVRSGERGEDRAIAHAVA